MCTHTHIIDLHPWGTTKQSKFNDGVSVHVLCTLSFAGLFHDVLVHLNDAGLMDTGIELWYFLR